MPLQVLFFGQLVEIGGDAISVPFAATLRDLEQLLFKQFPQLKGKKYALSVNQKIVTGDVALEEGSVIALLPPFSGG